MTYGRTGLRAAHLTSELLAQLDASWQTLGSGWLSLRDQQKKEHVQLITFQGDMFHMTSVQFKKGVMKHHYRYYISFVG